MFFEILFWAALARVWLLRETGWVWDDLDLVGCGIDGMAAGVLAI